MLRASSQIWQLSNRSGEPHLSRDDFYIAMFLVSLAQHGVPLSRASFAQYADAGAQVCRVVAVTVVSCCRVCTTDG